MRTLAIKELIEFQERSEKSKKKFAAELKRSKDEKKDTEGGGHYWISSLSAISSGFKHKDKSLIKKRIEELEEKLQNADLDRTKTMYQRNIDILYNYETFDFKRWRLANELKFQTCEQSKSILNINGLKIKVLPSQIFSSSKNEIGGLWLVAKLEGYRKNDLGIFADLLNIYLNTNFSNYKIISKYCLAVDVTSKSEITYAEIENYQSKSELDNIINEITLLM